MIYFKTDNVALFEQMMLSDITGVKTKLTNPRTGEIDLAFRTRGEKEKKCERIGMTYNSKCKDIEMIDATRQMLANGMHRKDIAAKLNISTRSLRLMIKRFNLA